MKPNKLDDKCARCNKRRGVISCFDEENETYWICDKCDKKMGWTE